MVARRVLYLVMTVWSLPWFLLIASDQRRLILAQDAGTGPQHVGVAMFTWLVFVCCVPFALTAIVLTVYVWGRAPRAVHKELAAWFGLLAVVGTNVVTFGASFRPLAGGARVVVGWIDVALQASLVLLPLVFFAASVVARADGQSLASVAPQPQLPAMDDKKNRNEGEGNKSADKSYREAATDFAKRTDTVQAGLQAERDVEKRKGEFDKAEQAGRSHSKGELPKDLSGEDFEKK